MAVAIHGPHAAIVTDSPRERFTLDLFDHLWERFRNRVSFVNTYEKIVHDHSATFFNDHIAFRTFASQNPQTGISSLSRLFEALGYRAADSYQFEDKHLGALYFQHPHPKFPKLFISELRACELSLPAIDIIHDTIKTHRPNPDERFLARLAHLDQSTADREELLRQSVALIHELPWELPRKKDVIDLNKESQYGAWVLVHGYQVNHFTSLINSHGVEGLNDIEKTAAAMAGAGVPMKKEIEGAPGSKLRQTATEAVNIPVEVEDGGKTVSIPWTYAYFELAQRDPFIDKDSGKLVRYEGFLGPQATNLFDMTKVK